MYGHFRQFKYSAVYRSEKQIIKNIEEKEKLLT